MRKITSKILEKITTGEKVYICVALENQPRHVLGRIKCNNKVYESSFAFRKSLTPHIVRGDRIEVDGEILVVDRVDASCDSNDAGGFIWYWIFYTTKESVK